MRGIEFIIYIFPYLALGLFFLGTAWRLIHWWFQPAHVKWTLYPVPDGMPKQLKYMVKEIFTFETLYRFNRPLWIGTYALHMAMLGFVIFLAAYVIGWAPGWPVKFFLGVLLAAAVYIIGLRLYDRNLRAVSTGEEFFNLGFLFLVAAACLLASTPHGISSPRAYFLSLAALRPDGAGLVWEHYVAVFLGGVFLIYLPWSKMVHYVAKYFTYHQINWQKYC
jgi:nitrate reductase gamma subunit